VTIASTVRAVAVQSLRLLRERGDGSVHNRPCARIALEPFEQGAERGGMLLFESADCCLPGCFELATIAVSMAIDKPQAIGDAPAGPSASRV
jgi:hypothetical protein